MPPNSTSVLGIRNPYEWSIDVSAKLDPKKERGDFVMKTSVGLSLTATYFFLRPLPET